MKMWAVQLQVVCESHESALVYAKRLNEALKSRQVPLPKGYKLAEIGVAQGDWEPHLPPDRPIAEVTLRDGGDDS